MRLEKRCVCVCVCWGVTVQFGCDRCGTERTWRQAHTIAQIFRQDMMASTPTIGEFFKMLCEMGFSEAQIQTAMQAGHFSVSDAAEWILQNGSPRHKLTKQAREAQVAAISAFNPPKHLDIPSSAGTSQSYTEESETKVPTDPSDPAEDPVPLASRIRQDKSDFQEQERQRVAQAVLAEKKQKKQERELVLKRIAEDRRSLQEKTQSTSQASTSSSPSEGERLGGSVQTNVDNQCILMIRLPSGESMRERFSADAPLRSVVEHIMGRHPTLSSFSLLQGFPRKRFSEAELSCSLRSLGLTPNAALCIQTTPPDTPSPAACHRWERDAGLPSPHRSDPEEETEVVEERLEPSLPPAQPPPLPQRWEEPMRHIEIPGVGPPRTGPSHSWGRGQRLVTGEGAEEDSSSGGEEEQLHVENEEELPFPFPGLLQLPFFAENQGLRGVEPRHHWPDQGNRLVEMPSGEEAPDDQRVIPGAAGQAAVDRLQRAALQYDSFSSASQPSPPKKPFRTPSVSTLCTMATRATVSLMMAPSMQYSSSLAGLTPELAELLLNHMARERLLRPRTLELFFGCPLQKLVLNCYPYSTNELLRQLRAFTALKHLSLVSSPLITDVGLSVLCYLQKLQHLNLAFCSKLTDSCLQHIAGLKALSFLSLDQTKVSDTGMVAYLLSAPSSLHQLSLNETSVTESTLAVLPSSVPQLRLLSIKQTKVADVSALQQLPHLQTLHLDRSCVTETSLQGLATHPALASLGLAGIPIADGNNTLQIVSGLRLTHLTLPGRHVVTDTGLGFLCRLSLLAELDLTDYTHVTDQGIAQLANMTRLKKLSLSNTLLTDTGLPALCSLQELLELCLDRTSVTSRGVAACVTCMPHLQVLGLASTQVGDTVIRRGLLRCTQLLKLNLSRTRITDHGLKFLRQMHLSQVNLDGTGVTLTGITNFISSCPHISSIRASHIRAIPPDQVSDDDGDNPES